MLNMDKISYMAAFDENGKELVRFNKIYDLKGRQ